MTRQRIFQSLCIDILASLFVGISITVFAVQANFAPGGITGLALITNHLTNLPIGALTVLFNIPIILATFRYLGRNFFLLSLKTMLISAFFIDYVTCHLPVFTGSRLIACILAGISAGVGYSLLYNYGSSTGGTDYVIVALHKLKPKLSFGLLTIVIDETVVVLSVFIFREFWAFLYGTLYSIIVGLAVDWTSAVLKKRIGASLPHDEIANDSHP